MKTIVSISEINSLELRPSSLLEEWSQLVEADIKMQWQGKDGWDHVDWPDQHSDIFHAFNKNGFDYVKQKATSAKKNNGEFSIVQIEPSCTEKFSWTAIGN